MKISFHGTGASEGFPALFCECEHCVKVRSMEAKNFRMRTSCSVDESLLIDFSADTYARCLYGNLNLTKVKHVIITHSHGDHLYPLDLFRIIPPHGIHERSEPLYVYGNERVGKTLEHYGNERDGKTLENYGIASTSASKYLRFQMLEAFQSYQVGEHLVTPLPANHDPQEACFIYVIENGGKTLLYGHDTGPFFKETWKALAKFRLDAAVLDCTHCGDACPYPTHMGIPDNLLIKRRMMAEGIADENTAFILTHFVHAYGPFYDSMQKLAAENGMIAAYDGFSCRP